MALSSAPQPVVPPGTQLMARNYAINGAVQPDETGQMRLSFSISPEPVDKEAAIEVAKSLAHQLLQITGIIAEKDIKLRDMEMRHQELTNEYVKVLQQKADLEGKVSLLNSQLFKLQEKHDQLDLSLQHTNEELKKTTDELNRMKVLAGVGSWIEDARRRILAYLGVTNVTVQTASEEWAKKVKNNQPAVLQAIHQLFGLTKQDWLIISKDFHSKTRSSAFHYQPGFQEVMELLDCLPSPNDQKPVFSQFIVSLNTLMEADAIEEPEL